MITLKIKFDKRAIFKEEWDCYVNNAKLFHIVQTDDEKWQYFSSFDDGKDGYYSIDDAIEGLKMHIEEWLQQEVEVVYDRT